MMAGLVPAITIGDARIGRHAGPLCGHRDKPGHHGELGRAALRTQGAISARSRSEQPDDRRDDDDGRECD